MVSFIKVSKLKIMPLILSILFLFNSTLYACPISKDTLRSESIFKNEKHRERIRETLKISGKTVVASSGLSRRGFLGIIPVIASTVSIVFADKQEGQAVVYNVSDEGIAYRVVEFLTVLKDRIERGLGTPIFILEDSYSWEHSLADLSKADLKRAHVLYKDHLNVIKKQKISSEKDILDQVIASIRNKYQRLVDGRTQGTFTVLGESLSKIGQEKYPGTDIDVLIAEPAVALKRCEFNGANPIPSQKQIVFVATNTTLFIDEVVVPLISGKKVVRWVNRGFVCADSRIQDIFADIIRRNFSARPREDCFNILKSGILRHEKVHQKEAVFDRPGFEAALRQVFNAEEFLKTRDTGMSSEQFISRIATEFDAYSDELEGDFPDVSFIRMLEVIEKNFNMPGLTYYPTYVALSIIFKELCNVDLFQFLFSYSPNSKEVAAKTIKNFITSNFKNGDQIKCKDLVSEIRVKYGFLGLAAQWREQRNQL